MLKATKGVSSNKKLGYGVWATYRKVGLAEHGGTCPATCKHLKDKTCYAMYGRVVMANKDATRGESDASILREWLRHIPKHGLVRHHVAGDVIGEDGKPDMAYIEAMVQGHEESGARGWGYTHAWRDLEPSSCNTRHLTMNASCDTYEEAREALELGWPTVVVVKHDDHDPAPITLTSGEEIPVRVCLEQSSQTPCSVCKKCLRSGRKEVVAFLAHGTKKRLIGGD